MRKMKIISAVIFLSLCLFSFVSCNENSDGVAQITVDGKAAEAITFDAAGGSKTVIIRGTKAWTAESPEWITVEPGSGAANTDITVAISVEANTSKEELVGGVTFVLPSSEFVSVIVNQLRAAN